MTHGLWWSFGEPREEREKLVADFYYQTGKHVELRIPWPAKRFAEAGELPIRLGNGERDNGWIPDLTSNTAETGRRLYDLLGKDAQTSLIRAFANLKEDRADRVLRLYFPTPSPENRELCLALEDLPWELLHDGEEFICWRYSLQIIRSHAREAFTAPPRLVDVASWGILLVSPFVFASEEQCRQVGLEALPQGRDEAKILRMLEKQTHGLVRIGPAAKRGNWGGAATFGELERLLSDGGGKRFQMIHYIGHGVIYDDEPCLCFEKENGGIDYVSVSRLKKLFKTMQDASPRQEPPAALFLNACSSSSRGRYSAGFASGLHDLGLCVLGYHSEIYDDGKPLLAARNFYQSLCADQSLQQPNTPPNVATAVGAARRRLRNEENEAKPAWGSLRVYLPSDISFAVHGRGLLEKTMQKVYAHFSQWMNPGDYTDHLAIGFQFAVLFGALMGLVNLAFIFPESVLSKHFNYQEIVSEITRVFLVGPLSYLAAAIFIAMQTHRNHQFILRQGERVSHWRLAGYCLGSLPVYLLAGIAFAALFFYSFSRLELLTAQTTAFASITHIPITFFWYIFTGVLAGTMVLSLLAASWLCLYQKETLHSYRTFYFILSLYSSIASAYLLYKTFVPGVSPYRAGGWTIFVLLNIAGYGLAATKILKEISWRASQKSAAAPLSWRKLLPLLGAVILVVFCYSLLEESVRFEQSAIQTALLNRKESATAGVYDKRDEIVLERALRQRAVNEIPESIKQAAKKDWLLSVVCADYCLYRTQQDKNGEWFEITLDDAQGYDAKDWLELAAQNNREVEFKDYYCNILAMLRYLEADRNPNKDEKRRGYEEAVKKAAFAVKKEDRNFAYLDTLARAEERLATLNDDRSLLKTGAAHIQEAQWRAFFLRSPRAKEVQRAIDQLAEKIQGELRR